MANCNGQVEKKVIDEDVAIETCIPHHHPVVSFLFYLKLHLFLLFTLAVLLGLLDGRCLLELFGGGLGMVVEVDELEDKKD